MYIMPTSTASDATREPAQSDFSHSLQEFRLVSGKLRGLRHLALGATALRGLGRVTRRTGEPRVDMQATAIKVFRRLAIEPIGLLAALGDADELQKASTI